MYDCGVFHEAHPSDSAMILAWIDVTQNLTGLTAEGVKVIPQHAMSRLTEDHLAQLSELATSGLRAEQIRSLSPGQLAALQHLEWISPQATAGFTPEQIAQLSLDQFAAAIARLRGQLRPDITLCGALTEHFWLER